MSLAVPRYTLQLQAYLTDGPGNLYGEICPASRAKMLKPDLKHRSVSLMLCSRETRPFFLRHPTDWTFFEEVQGTLEWLSRN
jgi:hypothetical protein